MGRQVIYTDPNDPVVKRQQNDLRFFVALIDIIVEEKYRLAWQIEGQKIALANTIAAEKYKEEHPNSLPSVAVPSNSVTEEIKMHFEDLKNTINQAQGIAQEQAHKTIEDFFGDAPENKSVKEKSHRIAEKTFSPDTLKEVTPLARAIQDKTVTKESLCRDAHPSMHSVLIERFEKVEAAQQRPSPTTKTPDTKKDADVIALAYEMKFAQEMAVELKRPGVEILVNSTPTDAQKIMIAEQKTNTLMRNEKQAWTLGYCNSENAFTESTFSQESDLAKYLARNPKAYEKNSTDAHPELHQLVDAEVKNLKGKSVGEKLAQEAEQIKKLHDDKMQPIINTLSTTTAENMQQATNKLSTTATITAAPTPTPASTLKPQQEKPHIAQAAGTTTASATPASSPSTPHL